MSVALEKGLYSILSGNSPQTSAASRIYPRLPQNATYPLVRYQRITTIREQALDMAVGVTEATIQVDCMATSYSAAKTLADEVRSILHDYTGAWGTLTARHVALAMETDQYEQDGDDITHWVIQRYRIWTDMD